MAKWAKQGGSSMGKDIDMIESESEEESVEEVKVAQKVSKKKPAAKKTKTIKKKL